MGSDACHDVASVQQFFAELEEDLVSLQALDSFEMLKEIIGYSSELGEYPQEYVCDEYKVHGCQSTVYIKANHEDGCVEFLAYSDAQVLRGYLGMLCRGLNGMKVDDFLQHAKQLVEGFAKRTNIAASVTPTRANAFGNIFALMESQVKEF